MTQKRTRRTVLAAGAAALGSLAGCVSGTEREGELEDDPGSSDGNDVDDDAENESGDTGGEAEADTGPYSVSMTPVGEVEFEEVPETWLAYESDYADMGVALGVGDGLKAIGEPYRFHTRYYDELGIEFDDSELPALYDDGVDLELFYQLEVDVHLIDPNWLENNGSFGLDADDVAEIREDVAPFVGNTIFRRTDEWHDYEYYTLYEAFEKVAQVFRREERYEAFASLHDDLQGEIEANLPAESERPEALLVWEGGDEPEAFYPYRVDDEGTNTKQFRDLGVADALAGTGIDGLSTTDRGTIDYETILDVDPDVLLVRGHEDKSGAEFADTVLGYMRDHGVASDLTAVQEGRVFRGGPIYPGPIVNLFATERAATELYPDRFEGELFDRDRVAEIVRGEL